MLLPVLRLALVAAAAVAATLFYSEVGNLRFILQTTSSNKSSCFVSSPTLLSERAPLHVFVRDGIESAAMEMNFWILLLQQLGRPLVMHSPSDQLIVSNSIVFCFDASPFADSVAAEMQNGTLRNVGLFHAGDENGASSTAQLHYGKFSFVFRSYWLEKIFSSDVPRLNRHLEWVPNGPRSNSGLPFVRSSLLPAHKRKHLCSFVGGITDNLVARTVSRMWMRKSLEKHGDPCFLDITKQFGASRSHSDYVAVMRDSMFTLCPRGQSEETIRFYDALQAGSIPVVFGRPNFLKLLPGKRGPLNPPFVTVYNWDETRAKLLRIAENKTALALMQSAAIDYFGEIERDAAARMRNVVDAVLAD